MKKDKSTIILAEDDPGIIEVVKIILEEEGYQTEVAPTRKEIHALCQKLKPGLIFLDIALSGDNGSDIADELKSHKMWKKIPVVLLSANDNIEKIAAKTKADGFLQKPFEIDELLATVKKFSK